MAEVLLLIGSIILGLLILTFLVAIHELGHGILARRNGVVVEEFGIGFPPRAKKWKVKKSILGENVTYSLNWLPLGGFVKLQGEHDSDTGKGDYGAASFWAKTKILLAGVAVNWLAAVVLLAGLSLYGIPKLLPDSIGQFTVASDTTVIGEPPRILSVQDGSPAMEAGLQQGDTVLRFDGAEVASSDALITAGREAAGQTVDVVIDRDGSEQTLTVTLRDEQAGSEQGYLGAGLDGRERLRATWSAPIVGVGLTMQMTWLTLNGVAETLANFVVGVVQQINPDGAQREAAREKVAEAGQNVAGPVGLIGAILPRLIEAGPAHIILITAIISLSLAVLNALPIPALDGGRWFLTAVYRLLRRPLTAEREEAINATGFLILIGLFILITIADIGKF